MSKRKKQDPELEKKAKNLEETYRKMVIFKRQKNSPSGAFHAGHRPIVVTVDGEIKEVDPYDIPDTTTYHRGLGITTDESLK